MDLVIKPRKLTGEISAIPSKSQAHRILICAALSNNQTEIICPATSLDIEATVNCLNALGAEISRTASGYLVYPIRNVPEKAELRCGESGSTLRFLLPVAGALGIDTTFLLDGRLPQRPLSPLWEEMERMGCILTRPSEDTVRCQGRLQKGIYKIDGGVSSQFITGLYFALAILGASSLIIQGSVQSAPYINQTKQVLTTFGVSIANESVSTSIPLHSPGKVTVEGDWSNGAFFIAAEALGNTVTVTNLRQESTQGDKAIIELLKQLEFNCTIDVAQIPDLMPILSIVAAASHGAEFTNIQRLRLKESDRVTSTCNMLSALGIRTQTTDDKLTVYPGELQGGIIDSCNDHRIAMSAAIATTVAKGDILLKNAQCVNKSYPHFWDDFCKLGGSYEQYIR